MHDAVVGLFPNALHAPSRKPNDKIFRSKRLLMMMMMSSKILTFGPARFHFLYRPSLKPTLLPRPLSLS